MLCSCSSGLKKKEREGISLGMNIFQLHLGKLPQPQPCIPKPWQTKQCRTALCSPFPDFPAGTFLWQICILSRQKPAPHSRQGQSDHTVSSHLPHLQEVFIAVPLQSKQKRKQFKVDPVCSCHYVTFDSGSLELLLERAALSTSQSCRLGQTGFANN